jgi:hypothetical protein
MKNPRQTTTALYVAAGVLLFAAIVMGAFTLGSHKKPTAPTNAENAAGALSNAPAVVTHESSNASIAQPVANAENAEASATSTEGREEAAKAAAIELKPDWSYSVDGHSRDWKEVSVYGGSEEGKWEAILQFRWVSGRYVYEGQKPYPGAKKPAPKASASGAGSGEAPLTEDDLKGIPREYRPGESTALEVALSGHPDWQGKVESHSKDWATAVVRIGPANSEYVSELHLKWSRKGQFYEVAKTKDLD